MPPLRAETPTPAVAIMVGGGHDFLASADIEETGGQRKPAEAKRRIAKLKKKESESRRGGGISRSVMKFNAIF
jgi:hypothetical protein